MIFFYNYTSPTQGQIQLVQTLRKYNSMQDLSSNRDATDNASFQQGGVDRRTTWYGPGSGSATFDPDEDTKILQRQYRSGSSIPEEEYNEDVVEQRMQRSSSDM